MYLPRSADSKFSADVDGGMEIGLVCISFLRSAICDQQLWGFKIGYRPASSSQFKFSASHRRTFEHSTRRKLIASDSDFVACCCRLRFISGSCS